ncbi:MAG: ATP phosphoribosyltransferase regulatory subunit [Eggerthellaceae bacterium]|nr:ATP phosphoribosyltransferase regulatory subunit [Eggerthellaceae bacterium]
MNFVTPSGFRDVMPDEALQREQITERVRGCLAARGYTPIETPTLESVEVMEAAANLPGTPFRFFDANGDLLALRPDVTMQVARMCATRLRGQQGPFRFRYTQRVFRESVAAAASRELTQVGIENIGEEGPAVDAQIVGLFAESLQLAGLENFTIALGTVSVLRALLEACPASGAWKNQVLAAYHASNFVELDQLVGQDGVPVEYARAIARLPRVRGGREAIRMARDLAQPLGCDIGLDTLEQVLDQLETLGLEQTLLVDFSIMSSFDYYTGIVFEAYAPGLGEPLGSGGRYDSMLAAYDGTPRPAAGFAFYLEQVMAALAEQGVKEDACGDAGKAFEWSAPQEREQEAAVRNRPLRIAVPKGSLNAGTIEVLQRAGLDTAGLEDPGRQLIIHNPGVDYIIVRPTDAPVFVALGAADCGICGKDSLMEANLDVVELVDLHFGGCRFVVAEPEGTTPKVEERYRKLGSIRIATKYPRITRAYYERQGMQVDIVQLHGNIELAPLIGMAERIVDITATGATLKQNNLCIVDDVISSTARFFANGCAFRMDSRVIALAAALHEHIEGK